MKDPKFSIVIATYNAEKTLERCMNSIASQTFRDFEVLIADGLSKDRTLEILKKYSDIISIQISEQDRGIYDAWNKVVPKAKGEWLYFLGADDELYDVDTLSKVNALLSDVSENVAYGRVEIILPQGETLTIEGESWKTSRKKFKHEMTIPHQGTFHSQKLFSQHGLFDASFRICGDYEFLLRELKDHEAFFLEDIIIAKMAFGGTSSTYGNVKKIIDELDLARRKNGLSAPSMYILGRRFRFHTRSMIISILGKDVADNIADIYRRMVGKPKLWGRLRK